MKEIHMADPNSPAHQADAESAAERSETYEPDELDATLARQQGLGVGQKDMERQRDPTQSVEPRTFQSTVDIGDPDEPASGGMQQGGNHTKREEKNETYGQGAKTLAAQREQQKRST
jgi:hypothetical protein